MAASSTNRVWYEVCIVGNDDVVMRAAKALYNITCRDFNHTVRKGKISWLKFTAERGAPIIKCLHSNHIKTRRHDNPLAVANTGEEHSGDSSTESEVVYSQEIEAPTPVNSVANYNSANTEQQNL